MSDYLRGVRGYLAFGGRNFLHAVNEPVAAQGVHHVDDRLFRLRPERVGQLLLQATQLRGRHINVIRVITDSHITGTESGGNAQQSARSSQSRLAHSHKRRASTTSGTSQIQRARTNGRENGTQHAPLRNDLIEPVEHVHKLLPLVLNATDTRGTGGHALHDLAEISALELSENVNRARSGEIHEVRAGGCGLQVHIHVQGVVLILELLDAFLGTAHIQVEIDLILGIRVKLDLLRSFTQTPDKTLLLELDISWNGKPCMLQRLQTSFEPVGTIQIQADATVLISRLRLLADDRFKTAHGLDVILVLQRNGNLGGIRLNLLQQCAEFANLSVRSLHIQQVAGAKRTVLQQGVLHSTNRPNPLRHFVGQQLRLFTGQ